jgi:hypothetical protein
MARSGIGPTQNASTAEQKLRRFCLQVALRTRRRRRHERRLTGAPYERPNALIARLKLARADRIEALQRFLEAPLAAVRRLARKLRQAPKLAFKIAARRVPPSPHLSPDHIDECGNLLWPALNSS